MYINTSIHQHINTSTDQHINSMNTNTSTSPTHVHQHINSVNTNTSTVFLIFLLAFRFVSLTLFLRFSNGPSVSYDNTTGALHGLFVCLPGELMVSTHQYRTQSRTRQHISLLTWLQRNTKNANSGIVAEDVQVHIFTDSLYVYNTLPNTFIPAKHFYLIEDIKNLALRLESNFILTIHYFPSHIKRTCFGNGEIIGNVKADQLANEGRERASELISPVNLCAYRDKIFDLSAALVSNIDTLLTECTQPTDGPSLDDFSLSDANRDTSSKVP